jgi:hypothetical protein
MSALGGEADVNGELPQRPLLTLSDRSRELHCTAARSEDRGGGGWPWVLSDLKSLLETGKRMSA